MRGASPTDGPDLVRSRFDPPSRHAGENPEPRLEAQRL